MIDVKIDVRIFPPDISVRILIKTAASHVTESYHCDISRDKSVTYVTENRIFRKKQGPPNEQKTLNFY